MNTKLIDTERFHQRAIDRAACNILRDNENEGPGTDQYCEKCCTWRNDDRPFCTLEATLIRPSDDSPPALLFELQTRYACFICPDCRQAGASAAATDAAEQGEQQQDSDEPGEQLCPIHVKAVYTLHSSDIDNISKGFVVQCPDCGQASQLLGCQQAVLQHIQQHSSTNSSASKPCSTLQQCLAQGRYHSPGAFGSSDEQGQPVADDVIVQLLARAVTTAALHILKATRPLPGPQAMKVVQEAAKAAAAGLRVAPGSNLSFSSSGYEQLLPWRQWAAWSLSQNVALIAAANFARPSLHTLQPNGRTSLWDMITSPPYVAVIERDAGRTVEKLVVLLNRAKQQRQHPPAPAQEEAAAAAAAAPAAGGGGGGGGSTSSGSSAAAAAAATAGSTAGASSSATASALLCQLLSGDPVFRHIPAQQRVQEFLHQAGISSIAEVAAAMAQPSVTTHLEMCASCGLNRKQLKSIRKSSRLLKCACCIMCICPACYNSTEDALDPETSGPVAAAAVKKAPASAVGSSSFVRCPWCEDHPDAVAGQHCYEAGSTAGMNQGAAAAGPGCSGSGGHRPAPAAAAAAAAAAATAVGAAGVPSRPSSSRPLRASARQCAAKLSHALQESARRPTNGAGLAPGASCDSGVLGGQQQQPGHRQHSTDLQQHSSRQPAGGCGLHSYTDEQDVGRQAQHTNMDVDAVHAAQDQASRPDNQAGRPDNQPDSLAVMQLGQQLVQPGAADKESRRVHWRQQQQQNQFAASGAAGLVQNSQQPEALDLQQRAHKRQCTQLAGAALGAAASNSQPVPWLSMQGPDAAGGLPPTAVQQQLRVHDSGVGPRSRVASDARTGAAAAAGVGAAAPPPLRFLAAIKREHGAEVAGSSGSRDQQQQQQQQEGQVAAADPASAAAAAAAAAAAEGAAAAAAAEGAAGEAGAAAPAAGGADAGSTGQAAAAAEAFKSHKNKVNKEVLDLMIALPAHQQLLNQMLLRKRRLAASFSSARDVGDLSGLQVLSQAVSGLTALPGSSSRGLMLQCLGQAVPGQYGPAGDAASSLQCTGLDLLMCCWCKEVQLTGCAVDQAAAAAAEGLVAKAYAAGAGGRLAGFLAGLCQLLLDLLQTAAVAIAAGETSSTAAADPQGAAAAAADTSAGVGDLLQLSQHLLRGTAVLLLQWPAGHRCHDARCVQAGLWRHSMISAMQLLAMSDQPAVSRLQAAGQEVNDQLEELAGCYSEVSTLAGTAEV